VAYLAIMHAHPPPRSAHAPAFIDRREFLAGAVAVALAGPAALRLHHDHAMYGLIGKMNAAPGRRDELIAILLEGTREMPGCLSYVVARDPTDADAIWITEIWESEEMHRASLELPAVRAAIARGREMIAGFGERYETEPVGVRNEELRMKN
jgi:quinol monooxygenase YgiN